ncbi:MAG: hypothetical protein GC164_03420 [Phycisphaera sp.]|nr:hypothetical protein [Phycisphaera sp.]
MSMTKRGALEEVMDGFIPQRSQAAAISAEGWVEDALDEPSRPIPDIRTVVGKISFSAKRLMDLFLVLLSCPLSVPMMLLIAVAIKLDSPGPVFFVQKRPGLHGKLFRIYKFRTMHQREARYLKPMDASVRDELESFGKAKSDPRVTRVGKVLRRSSLDELPQLINIFLGDMSFVGPRPFLRRQVSLMGQRKPTITRVRPGLTGLWQTSGRSDIPLRRRVAMDVYYARKRTLLLDTLILLKTVFVVLWGKGAY